MQERALSIARTSGIESQSEHHIEAETSLVERHLRTLKHGDAFGVFDGYGDIGTPGKDGSGPEGLFFRDTRFLSRLELRLEDKRPLLLSSVIQDDNAALSVDLANPDITGRNGPDLPRDTIYLSRTKLLWRGACYERLGLRNFDRRAQDFALDLGFDADFRDLFEVRGEERKRHGRRSIRILSDDRVQFRYQGLDGLTRLTTLAFSPAPARLADHAAHFDLTLGPGERSSLFITIVCEIEGADTGTEVTDFGFAFRDTRRALRAKLAGTATVETSNRLFDQVIGRATSDIYMLLTQTKHGLYPYAGIPWFSTAFGRDGIITAMEMLWTDPSIAGGVLRYLAATQATDTDPAADAQPGKILHERRHGEMARLGEVPFRKYYGSIDATPLFLMLAGQYFDRTGDMALVSEIWPNIEAALRWIDDYGDRDRDGFVEYQRETSRGLANQGWKDSNDSIMHADGTLAQGPIALVEVQGYVYAAKRHAADLASALGQEALATRLGREAEQLKDRFAQAFWCDDIGTYALALDGDKRPCGVRASNAGHALFTGIASPERARRVMETLTSEASFCGWGVRTLARGEARYNPMSYHNGSVWPHDNALIALGFARYGFKWEAARIFEGMFRASNYQDQHRLPELFCGFQRRRRRGPTAYPVACSPQAWASAAPFAFLAACLGLELAHAQNEIRFKDPVMPDFLEQVTIRNLRLGDSRFDLHFHRLGRDVALNVLKRDGHVRVIVLK